MPFLTDTTRALVDLFLPPCCGGCGAPIPSGVLCELCAGLIEPVVSPRCPRCALPFEAPGRDHECGGCLRKPPPFASASAAFLYGGPIADGLRALKYGPRPERLGPLSELWRQAATDLPDVDLAVPVPLHPSRLRKRGFNQATMLAKPLLRDHQVPLDTGSLRRVRPGEAQAGLSGRARRDAPKGAFLVPTRRRPRLTGRRILLVDDVMTTGATLRAAAATLRRAGSAEVHVAVLARAERDRRA